MSKSELKENNIMKILSILAIAFALAAVAVSLPTEQSDADATSGTCGDGVAWSFDKDTATLSITYTGTGTGRMADIDDPNKSEYAHLWKSIDNIVIGEGVTYIGNCAFTAFEAKSITLSSTVEGLGKASLEDNDITALDLMNVVTIGEMSLYKCKYLASIVIPSTVEVIGAYAFDECASLANVDTSEATSLTTIGQSAFVSTSLKSFYVPATVTSLGAGIFVQCYGLPAIEVDPNNTKYVDVDGVVYDIDMTTVLLYPPARACDSYEIPNTVTKLAKAAFATGEKIGAVTIPDTITVISDDAFYDCIGLKTIKIPNTVTSIGEFAFADCNSIESIDFSGTTVLKSIGNGAFLGNIKLKTVEIPACVESIGLRAFAQCTALETINIDSSNQYYTTVDGVLYDKKMETLMQFPGSCNMTEFTIPSTVKTVNINAFSNLTILTSLTFPDSVTTIGDGTTTHGSYQQTPLLKISIGNGLTKIEGGENPFIDHVFYDKEGHVLEQTVKNLKGHTFVGEDAEHMYIDDSPQPSKSDDGFPIWAIAVIVVVALAAVIGLVVWKRIH